LPDAPGIVWSGREYYQPAARVPCVAWFTIDDSEPRARTWGVQKQELLTVGKVLQNKVVTGRESRCQPAEQAAKARKHVRDLIDPRKTRELASQ
jgi:hypothetical protein